MAYLSNLLSNFRMGYRSLLSLNLFQTLLEICAWHPVSLVHTRNPHWGMGEKMVHLFKWTPGSLG